MELLMESSFPFILSPVTLLKKSRRTPSTTFGSKNKPSDPSRSPCSSSALYKALDSSTYSFSTGKPVRSANSRADSGVPMPTSKISDPSGKSPSLSLQSFAADQQNTHPKCLSSAMTRTSPSLHAGSVTACPVAADLSTMAGASVSMAFFAASTAAACAFVSLETADDADTTWCARARRPCASRRAATSLSRGAFICTRESVIWT
mmetsp:Transcript_1260/g.2810  ORF Transcript_1260/g.2810 Transcript_1260/m.2810 type:complete len:205 (+) Transcript_1260:679-1293(+)